MEREEIRRCILPVKIKEFISYLISKGYKEVNYSKNNFLQTIYLDNNRYSLPFSTSIKLRRYLKFPQKKINIEKNREYFLEQKNTFYKKGRLLKKKNRTKLKGIEILDKFKLLNIGEVIKMNSLQYPPQISPIISNEFLNPHVATQYKRRNFLLGDILKITIDSNLEFFAFNGSNTANKIDEHKFVVVEVKLFDSSGKKAMEGALRKLREIYSLASVSKRCLCSNRLADHIQKKLSKEYRLFNEIPNYEFELKFNIKNIYPGVLFWILRSIFENKNKEFIVCPEQPWTKEIGTIQRYSKNEKREIEKISYAKDIFTKAVKIETKEEGNLMIRKENKDKPKKIISEKDIKENFGNCLGEFHRIRKSFWVVNKNSGRVYKIAVDNSYTPFSILSQVEIEYSGIRKGIILEKAENAIKKDLKKVNDLLLSSPYTQKYLIPTKLTKLDWLLSLGK